MSAYLASCIAGSDQTKTGIWAVRLGLIGFIIPFFFLDNPVLLIGVDQTASLTTTLWAVFTASVGTVSLVAGLEGWLVRKCNIGERILLIRGRAGHAVSGSLHGFNRAGLPGGGRYFPVYSPGKIEYNIYMYVSSRSCFQIAHCVSITYGVKLEVLALCKVAESKNRVGLLIFRKENYDKEMPGK
ncbi:MAG: hypothetical protein IJ238_01715 [Acidaminococcaceae bacterium]|nr:hypothetical protein [Acidaminococcaceae bacterium]